MDAMKRKELEVKKKKAEASKSELELKILEREQDLRRINDHIKLQDQIIADVDTELQKG